jgi:two-component system sensor histidine kinase MprB
VSLRVRLALVAGVAVAAAVVIASGIVFFLVRNELVGQLNRNLEDQAERIATMGRLIAIRTSDPKVQLLVTPGPLFRFGDSYFQLVDSTGIVYRPDLPRVSAIKLPASMHAMAVAGGAEPQYFANAHLGGDHVRIFTMPLGHAPSTPGVPQPPLLAVQVVGSLAPTDRELSKIRLWLIVVALGGSGIAFGLGFLVARSALRPVRRLSEAAEAVRATQDLSRRIEVGTQDELGQLATTFNAMLASLDEAAQRQRRLVQDASHELRTPLTSMRTNIELLASGSRIPAAERRHMLDDIVAQLSEMTVLIGELTELASGEGQPQAREEVRLDLLAEDAIRRTERNHPDVRIDAELAPTTAIGAPAPLERAIANLLDNAAKWSPPGAQVDVRLVDGELTVRDRGPGIADTDLPHIFERFYRATSARSMPGSGLGLAIVKQVADAHGGTIVAEPAPGGGTLMRLTVPNGNAPDKS